MTEESFNIRVYYEDTDAGGVVYHAVYVNYFERARSEWLRRRGLQQRQLAAEGVLFAVRRIALEYNKPAHLDDLLDARTSLKDVGKTSITFAQRLMLDAAEIASAEVRVVCVSGPPFRPCAFPPALQTHLCAANTAAV